MPRTFVHLAYFLFIITAVSGIWMRFMPFSPNFIINYDHILHAHSHIAILGWAFLGSFIVLLAILWPKLNLSQRRHGIFLTLTIFIVSIIMFIAFLYEGYAMYSIIMSTLHIFVEYWAMYFIYQQLKYQDHLPKIGKLFIHGSLAALFLSSIGPFLLGYLGATGMRESRFFDMAIYYFLHFQYNGWLFLFLIGVFIFILYIHNIQVKPKLFINGFWIYFIALFPWFFSAISWTEISAYDKVIANIGTTGQFIGTIVIIIATFNVWMRMKQTFSQLTIFCLSGTFLLLFFKSLMELGLISTPLATLVFETRSVIIGYLHFTLLGFVSLFILTQYQMVGFMNTNSRLVLTGTSIFIIGFIFNELILFLMGLLSWIDAFSLSYTNESLLLTSIILFIGIVLLWFSYSTSKKSKKAM